MEPLNINDLKRFAFTIRDDHPGRTAMPFVQPPSRWPAGGGGYTIRDPNSRKNRRRLGKAMKQAARDARYAARRAKEVAA